MIVRGDRVLYETCFLVLHDILCFEVILYIYNDYYILSIFRNCKYVLFMTNRVSFCAFVKYTLCEVFFLSFVLMISI